MSAHPILDAAPSVKKNDRISQLVGITKISMAMLAVSTLSTLAMAGWATHLSTQRKEIPYLVQTSEGGLSEYLKKLDPADMRNVAVVSNEVAGFISAVRMVSSDQKETYDRMLRAYQRSTDGTQQYVRDYYDTDRKLTDLYRDGITVYPESITVHAESESLYTAHWVEKIMQRGRVTATEHWQAKVYVLFAEPKNDQQRAISPLGIWIGSADGGGISWYK